MVSFQILWIWLFSTCPLFFYSGHSRPFYLVVCKSSVTIFKNTFLGCFWIQSQIFGLNLFCNCLLYKGFLVDTATLSYFCGLLRTYTISCSGNTQQYFSGNNALTIISKSTILRTCTISYSGNTQQYFSGNIHWPSSGNTLYPCQETYKRIFSENHKIYWKCTIFLLKKYSVASSQVSLRNTQKNLLMYDTTQLASLCILWQSKPLSLHT